MSDIVDRLCSIGLDEVNREVVPVLHSAAAEITRLRAIVDKLPKTADGVPVVPGEDMVWVYGRRLMMDVETQDNREAEHRFVLVSQVGGCWSSREAAEKAKEQGNV